MWGGARTQPPGDGDWGMSKRGRIRCIATNAGGSRCRCWAVRGYTTCAMHGGKGAMAITKFGKYAKVLKTTALKDAYLRFLNDDQKASLDDELAVSRALLEAALGAVDGIDLKDLTTKQLITVQHFIESVGKLVDVHARVESRLANVMTPADIHMLVNQVFDIIKRHIQDPAILSAISEDMQELTLPQGLNEEESQSEDAVCSDAV